MKDSADLREILLAYRLGKVSRRERQALDARIIGDGEWSDRLADVEYDLLDDYRGGRLTATDRNRVERAFLPGELTRLPWGAGSRTKLWRDRMSRRSWLSLATSAATPGLSPQLRCSHQFPRLPCAASSSSILKRARHRRCRRLRRTPKPASRNRGMKPHVAVASPAMAVLVLEPAVARGDRGAVLALQPSEAKFACSGFCQPEFQLHHSSCR